MADTFYDWNGADDRMAPVSYDYSNPAAPMRSSEQT
jgi:hypothetical protein